MKLHLLRFAAPVRFFSFFLASLTVVALAGCAGGSVAGSPPSPVPTPAVISIASISPKDVPVGSQAVTLIVTGSGFTSSTVVVLDGTSEPTTYVSSSEIHATVASAQMQTGKVLALVVKDGAQSVAADATNALQVDNPTPTLTAIAPSAVLVGSGATTLAVTGTNFVSGAVVDVNGSPRDTTFVSTTQLTAAISATDFAQAGALLFNVTNPQPGGGASGTDALLVSNPLPTVAAVSPGTLLAGAAATTVTITGTGFVSGTGVLVNGASRSAAYVSSTAMTVGVTAADLLAAGTLGITAVNPAPGGGVSSSATLAVNNPTPGALTLTPATLLAGNAAATVVTVTGSNFVPSSSIRVNGSARPTTFVTANQLLVSLESGDQATAGTLSVVAANPGPGGGSSPAASLTVTNPSPGAILVSPNLVGTGTATSTAITVTGANFVPSTVVQVNGNARQTTYVSSTQLISALTVADQASAGSLSVTAFTPAPGGGSSSAASIAVNNPTLGSLSLSPSVVPAGTTSNVTINVTGSGFIPGTSILVNGSARATTYVSASQLTFVLLVSDAVSARSISVTAANPAPSPSISPAATLTVAAPTPTPTITQVSPTSFIIGTGPATLYVYGTSFTSASTVQWNGTTLNSSYGYGAIYASGGYTYGYYLVAQVPASLLSTSGTASVTVTTSTALTPTSNAVPIAITNPPAPTLTSISPSVGPIATSTAITLSGAGFTSSSVVSFNGTALATTFNNSSSLSVTLPGTSNLFPGNGSFTINTPAPGGGTSDAQVFTSYVPLVSNSMIYSPVDGLLYLSIPASAGAPYGNSVVSMDPATGALGTPIQVGSEPNKLAITSDGRYLWVGLDGASGVRKIDLTTKTAGLQFALNNSTSNNGAATAIALLALPGATDSVIVLQGSNYYSSGLTIYDSGSLRGSMSALTYYSQYALQVDGSRNEIYVGGSGLYTYSYNSAGLTAKTTNSNPALASSSFDEMQLVSGALYDDFGKVYDAEAGTLLGTLYQTGTTAAQGPSFYDTTLGKIFTLDNNSSSYYSGYNQIQVFNPLDYSAASTVMPISVPSSIYNSAGVYTYFTPHRLVRWGSNGLAFHTSVGVFSLRSNSVRDLSTTIADLGVTVTASGGTTTGTSTTYTATVTNSGPSAATDVALAIQVPSTGVLVSASATSGTCSTSTSGCSLGSIASGATVTATISVLQTTAGTATLNVQVSGSTTDNTTSNNAASVSIAVTGNTYNLTPTLSSITPAAIRSGSSDTTLIVTGTNFTAGSTVMLGTTALTTTYTSTAQLSAIVPAANLTSMNWASISVVSPSPGGGASNAFPLTIYSVLSLGANHIVYDPFSRKLMTSVSTGSSTVAGNSLVAITPETASIGTPVVLTAQPTQLALSTSGQTLYAALNNTQSLSRYNMLTGVADTISIPTPSNNNYGTPYASGLAVQPNTENTLALSLGAYYYGLGIYDYSTSAKTLTARSSSSGLYNTYDCLRFGDPTNLFANSDSTYLTDFAVSATGLGSTTGTTYTLSRFSCFNLVNGTAYASQGGVATVSSTGLVQQIGSFTLPASYYYSSSSGSAPVAPDQSIGQVFFPGSTTLSSYGTADGLLSYDAKNYLRTAILPLNMSAIEGSTNYSQLDLVRWGQDGLAALTSTGHIYLVRGPFVVPQLLNSNTAAILTSGSPATITHGTGNILLTVTGSNFVPGVAATWNGSYRTTTIVDPTDISIAIPASDIASAGTAAIVATNPGAPSSGAISITIQ